MMLYIRGRYKETLLSCDREVLDYAHSKNIVWEEAICFACATTRFWPKRWNSGCGGVSYKKKDKAAGELARDPSKTAADSLLKSVEASAKHWAKQEAHVVPAKKMDKAAGELARDASKTAADSLLKSVEASEKAFTRQEAHVDPAKKMDKEAGALARNASVPAADSLLESVGASAHHWTRQEAHVDPAKKLFWFWYLPRSILNGRYSNIGKKDWR